MRAYCLSKSILLFTVIAFFQHVQAYSRVTSCPPLNTGCTVSFPGETYITWIVDTFPYSDASSVLASRSSKSLGLLITDSVVTTNLGGGPATITCCDPFMYTDGDIAIYFGSTTVDATYIGTICDLPAVAFTAVNAGTIYTKTELCPPISVPVGYDPLDKVSFTSAGFPSASPTAQSVVTTTSSSTMIISTTSSSLFPSSTSRTSTSSSAYSSSTSTSSSLVSVSMSTSTSTSIYSSTLVILSTSSMSSISSTSSFVTIVTISTSTIQITTISHSSSTMKTSSKPPVLTLTSPSSELPRPTSVESKAGQVNVYEWSSVLIVGWTCVAFVAGMALAG